MDYVVQQSAVGRERPTLPGQAVLVFQGGGALGAYQGGVYQAMHEAGIEPDWVVGTSIGAVNAAIIAGNDVNSRLDGLREFWRRIERKPLWGDLPFGYLAGNAASHLMTLFGGIPGYFSPNRRHRVGTQRVGRCRARRVLHDRRPPQDPRRSCRFRAHRGQTAAADDRGRQRANRQDALFRQPQRTDHARPRPGLGRSAAGLPGRPHRRRPVLGRRPLFEYAGRSGVRRQSAAQLRRVLGADISNRRAGA